MKKYNLKLLPLVAILLQVSCAINPFDEFESGNWNNERSILTLKFENQVGKETITRVDDRSGIIHLGINTGAMAEMSNIKITSLVLSYGAEADVKTGDALDFENESSSAKIKVTSPTGKTRDYTVIAEAFEETIIGTYKLNNLVVFGGTGPEYGGGGVLPMTEKPWVWLPSGGPAAELDNTLTIELEGFTEEGNSFGTLVNDAGADGLFADFQQVAFGSYPATDVNNFYRKIPTGTGKWSRNYATGMVTFTFADGTTSTGRFVEGPVTESLGNDYSKTVDNYAFSFNLNGTDDWNSIYSDYDKFIKRPRRFWIDLEKVE
ncbi:hypothetical protein [Algoriphagus sp.]|uniref:hypothetical protein n=1 Tax=Algoriphagus sp. TaxID=1872435 RepID=UPI003F6FEE74